MQLALRRECAAGKAHGGGSAGPVPENAFTFVTFSFSYSTGISRSAERIKALNTLAPADRPPWK